MELVLLAFIIGTLCIVCFLIGVNTAQKVEKGEKVELPTISPMKIIREHREQKELDREQKELEKEQNKIETILRNIESYDGTSNHQEDIPI